MRRTCQLVEIQLISQHGEESLSITKTERHEDETENFRHPCHLASEHIGHLWT
jgi:hypothetical protein